jgi:histidinol-phosphate aminotransferase
MISNKIIMIKSKELISQIDRPAPDSSSRANDFRFDRNERTTLFSNEEFEGMISQLTPYDFVAYGELEPFYAKISKWLQLSRDKLLLTSGSDMGIRSVFETFIKKGDRVLITQPNYAMFSVYNKMFGGIELVESYQENLSLDTNSLLNNLTEKIKLVVISNPGHTGKAIEQDELIKIIEKAEEQNTIVLIDEAYFHFYNESMLKYIDKYKNLIVSRTFSKAFGLASLRIGLLAANPELIKELYRVKLVHEITGVAAKIGSFMLDNMQIVDNYVNDVNEGKEILHNRLSKLDMQTYESNTNFLFFHLPSNTNTKGLMEYMGKNKIFIKGPFTNHPFKGQMRITVGDKVQMSMFCDKLDNYLSSH